MGQRSVEGFRSFLQMLRCPRCGAELSPPTETALACSSERCGERYPIAADRPVLIDESQSIFRKESYLAASGSKAAVGADESRGALAEWIRRLPSPSVNLSARRCLTRMRNSILAHGSAPIVLVVGGGIMGKGMRMLMEDSSIRPINIDVSPQSDAVMFCDAHSLPFASGSIDAVVVQAVLEHVADPVQCAAEIWRVLRPGGVVYSELPFMQEVHQEGYDFTRFSHMGQRRLFRRFAEMESGVVAGPGTTLAWAWRYFLAAFAPTKSAAKVLYWIGRVTGMLFEQADYFLGQRPGAHDAASCIYFLGTKADGVVTDSELVSGYRGAQR